MKDTISYRTAERGGAGVKFLLILTVILLVAHAGYNYVPVAYEAETLRTEMHTAVVQGLATPGKISPVDNVKARVNRAMVQNNAPPDALVHVKQTGGVVTAHVAFTRDVSLLPFGIYKYRYSFNHTATPTGFLTQE